MDHLLRDPEFISLIKGINLRYLLNTYLFLKPGASQNEIAKRLKVGQMTVSRMMTKDYAIKTDWVPAIAEMLYELREAPVVEYAKEIWKLGHIFEDAVLLQDHQKISTIVYKQLLSTVSQDFTQSDITSHGFSYFSWDKKITWEFANADTLLQIQTSRFEFGSEIPDDETLLHRLFPKRTDRVTLFTTSPQAFEYANYWCSDVKIVAPTFLYMAQQEHSLILVNLEKGIIEEEVGLVFAI